MATKEQEELAARLRSLIAAGQLPEGSAAYYLAKQVADEGKGSLMSHQLRAWETLIKPILEAPADEIRKVDSEFGRGRAGH
jgi:hypothetical protein